MTNNLRLHDQNLKSFKTADNLLQWLKDNYSFVLTAPVDINKITEFLDLKIEYDYSVDDNVGKIAFSENGQATISINLLENSYEPRRRFTLAHEIGHYCLHRATDRKEFLDNRKTMSRSGSYWDVYESEANQFAAELLMPIDLLLEKGIEVIKAYLDKNKTKDMPEEVFIKEMAATFQVSNPAMEYRLKNLSII